jgi:hypothetical protein
MVQDTDWDNLGSTSCRFIEDVIKGTSTMHRVLQQHLPPSQIQARFTMSFIHPSSEEHGVCGLFDFRSPGTFSAAFSPC